MMMRHNRDRLPSTEGSAGSTEQTGQSTETKVDYLIATAVEVKRKLRLRNITFMVVGFVFAAMLVFCVVVIQGLRGQADNIEGIARENKANGDTLRENSEAIKTATGPEAAARSVAAIQIIKEQITSESDCLSRRQQVRLPAPENPKASCASQTDPSIYPGVVGQPSR